MPAVIACCSAATLAPRTSTPDPAIISLRVPASHRQPRLRG
jgi:hypothetical protein